MKTAKCPLLLVASWPVVALLLILCSPGPTNAADSIYPSRPVTVVVPVPPGGSTDLGARLLAQFMEKELKQPVVITNKAGAAGTVGGYAVASAKPDGYTLGYLAGSGAVPEPYTYFYSAPYSSSDLRPISRVHIPIITITVKGDAPWTSLKDLVEYSRKNPGMKYGHLGKSTTQYVVMATVVRGDKLKMVDVPYDGDGSMVPALLGGHIPIGTPVLYVIKSLLDSKKLKVLAVALDHRAPSAPDTPTLSELGYKMAYGSFLGLYGPKKLPDEVARRVDEAVRRVVANREFQEKNRAMDMPVEYLGGAAFEKFVAQYKTNVQNFLKEKGLVKK